MELKRLKLIKSSQIETKELIINYKNIIKILKYLISEKKKKFFTINKYFSM